MIGLFKENTKIALGSIKSQLLRTILTVIIIAIGIMALVGVLTVVSALDNTLLKNFASMGSNTFSITQYDFSEEISQEEEKKVNPVITFAQAKSFQEKYSYPLTTTSISFFATSNAEVKFDNKKTDPEISVLGIDENYLPNKGIELTKGRNLNAFDVANNNYVCVLGANFTEELFDGMDPLDKTISIRGVKFKVLGILKEQGATFGNNQDLRIMIPFPIARSIFSTPNINYSLDVKVLNDAFLEQAVDNATITMRRVRGLSPIKKNDFGIKRSDDLIQRLAENTAVLNGIAWFIGIITVFGSTIALMNIMLVSVTERTREIGIRKSLGAKKNTIAWQFFTETFVIGQMGGIFGIILGILIGTLISMAAGFEFAIPWMAMIAAFVTTFLVTIISGVYPAVKAAKLDPVEALRYE
jgi:putative ABC transport system permease protein